MSLARECELELKIELTRESEPDLERLEGMLVTFPEPLR